MDERKIKRCEADDREAELMGSELNPIGLSEVDIGRNKHEVK